MTAPAMKVDPFAVGQAALDHMLDRRGLREPLEAIKYDDPDVWREICEETGRAAIRAMKGGAVPDGVGIKPLVWALTPNGVWQTDAGMAGSYMVADSQWWRTGQGEWIWVEGGNEAAKAAAQADFEAKVRAFLIGGAA